MSNKYDRHYPAIPLRNVTVFPGMVMHFDVSRKKSVKAVGKLKFILKHQ